MRMRRAGARNAPPPRMPLRTVLPAALFLVALAQAPVSAQKIPIYTSASFVDKNDIFIETLGPGEVEILEDGKLRKIEFMAREEIPAVYSFLFQKSMLPEDLSRERVSPGNISNASAARDLAYELIDKLIGRQSVMVASYGRELHPVMEFAADGYGAKNAIHQLRGSRAPEDPFLYSGLFSSVQLLQARPEKRRVLLVFLETLDPDTSGKAKQLRNLLSASNVELFTFFYGSRLENRPGAIQHAMAARMLNELTTLTAGRAFFAVDYRDHFEDVARRVFNQLRTLYTFGFESDSDAGTPMKLEIRCLRPGSKVAHHPATPVLK